MGQRPVRRKRVNKQNTKVLLVKYKETALITVSVEPNERARICDVVHDHSLYRLSHGWARLFVECLVKQ